MRTVGLALIVVLFGTPKAFAEPEQDAAVDARFFVSGGVIADEDHTWADETPGTVGFSASAGVNVSRHVGVRLQVDVPKTVTTRVEYTNPGPTSTSPSFRSTGTHRRRSISWSALIDVHGRLADRVRLGVVTGITVARRPDEYDASTDELGPGGVVLQHSETSMSYTFTWWGITAGVELPLALTSHLSVVPEARVTGFPLAEYGRTTIFRPGVSLRWGF